MFANDDSYIESLTEERKALIDKHMPELTTLAESYAKETVVVKEQNKSIKKNCFEDFDNAVIHSFGAEEFKKLDKLQKKSLLKSAKDVLKMYVNFKTKLLDDETDVVDKTKTKLTTMALMFMMAYALDEKSFMDIMSMCGMSIDVEKFSCWLTDTKFVSAIVDELTDVNDKEKKHKLYVDDGLNELSEPKLIYNKEMNPCGLKNSDFTKLVTMYADKMTKDSDKCTEKNTNVVENLLFANIRNDMMSEVITTNLV